MVYLTKKERNDMTMRAAMLYALTLKSMRGVARDLGIGKTTVHAWLTKILPDLDPQLSKIVQKKIALFKVQNYNHSLTPQEIRILKAKKRASYFEY